MVQTVVAYSESQDSAGALVNVAGVLDDHINVSGDDIRVPTEYNNLLAVLAIGGNLTQARLLSPSLRDLVNLDVAPLNAGATLPSSPTPYAKLWRSPIELEVGENLRCQVAEDIGGAQRATVVVWLGPGAIVPVRGDISTVRTTSATPLVANTWTSVPIVFDQVIPAGRYQLVGMRAISTTMVAARVVIPRWPWKPGCIGYDALEDVEDEVFRYGNMGVWAEFDSIQSLQVEGLANAADATQEYFFDIIRIGPLSG